MNYRKGDIITISGPNDSLDQCVIIQADWFNLGGPPSYIICPISAEVYPELDFRPVIKPDNKNKLASVSQILVDKVQAAKCAQIVTKVGAVDNKQIKEINGCLKAILGL